MKFLSCAIVVLLAVLTPSLATFDAIGEIKGKFGLGGSPGGTSGNYGRYGSAYYPGYAARSTAGYGGYASSYSGQQVAVGVGGYGYQRPQNEQVVRIIRVVAPNNYGSGYAPGYVANSNDCGNGVSPAVVPAKPPTQVTQVQVPQYQIQAAQVPQYQIQAAQVPQYQVQVAQPQRPPVLVALPQQQTVNYVPVAPTQVVATLPVAAPTVLQTYAPGVRSNQFIASSSAFTAPRYVGPSVQYSRTAFPSPPVSTVRLIYSNAGDNQQYSSSSASSASGGSYIQPPSQPNVVYGAPSSAELSATSYSSNGPAANTDC